MISIISQGQTALKCDFRLLAHLCKNTKLLDVWVWYRQKMKAERVLIIVLSKEYPRIPPKPKLFQCDTFKKMLARKHKINQAFQVSWYFFW